MQWIDWKVIVKLGKTNNYQLQYSVWKACQV